VSALERVRETNDILWQCHDLRQGLEQAIDAGIALVGADMGHIQLLNLEKQVLEIVAQRGFGPDFLEHFREVFAAEGSACGRSLRSNQRVVVEDVELDREFAPHLAVAAAAGYRAVQSTPLVGAGGETIGIFSTHFRKPHRPTDIELARFDLYANRVALFVERLRSEGQLQALTRKLLLAQEEDNRQVARELHDVFSQELMGISMEISSLKKNRKSECDQTAKRLHQTSRQLHPGVLEDLGLEPALRQECESFQSAYKIPTDFSANHVPANIPLDVALCLYRVVQESLRNVWKHAKDTDKVWVSLTGSPDGITLTVKDQGDGFELDAALRKGGLGLISMDERVRAESGKLTVQSKPGDGTVVTAFVPLENAELESPQQREDRG
jgi:signal transduction histidine kinase